MNYEDQRPPPPRASGLGGSGAGLAAETSRRIGSVLDAVEREAAQLREEAREDAARYLESAKRSADGLVAERQRRIAELSDELLTKAEALVAHLNDATPVRQGFENLALALGHAAERLARESEVSAADFEPPPSFAGGASQPESNRPRDPVAQEPPARGGAPGSSGWRELDDARMVAIQLAATGATRSVVRDHLTRALGISDPEEILDEIFGAGSGDAARVPWTAGPR